MPISSTDIAFYPCSVTAEGTAHGGAIVTTLGTLGTTLHAVWDRVTGDEAAAGDIEFRKIWAYLGAGAAASVLSSPVLWMSDNEGTTAESVYWSTVTGVVSNYLSDIGNQNSTYITANWSRNTAKTAGLTFTTGWASGTAAALGIWQARIINAGSGSVAADRIDLKIEGDTA